MLSETEKIYRLAFTRLGFVGPRKFETIKKYFGSAEKAWTAPYDLYQGLGWNENQISILKEWQGKFTPEKELKNLGAKKIALLALEDENYPKNLKEIPDPPFLIFVRGELKSEDEFSLAVVGSRKMSSYGYQVLETLIPDLVLAGLTIVSGLAFGVDYAVHKLALEGEGRAIAVLASGVDNITPRTNEQLGEYLIESGKGVIISELPPGTEPLNYFFPVRNRIISGLSLGTLVVEAAAKSGALYTAEAAVDQNREVFAVPGSIFSPLSEGTMNLIRKGAKLTTCAEDILSELNAETAKAQVQTRLALPENPEETAILEWLSIEEKHVDLLARESGWPISKVNSTLMALELKGLVKNTGGDIYRPVRHK